LQRTGLRTERPRGLLLAGCLLLPLAFSALPAGAADTSAAEPFSLMARPMHILRMVADPWMDGIWFGTEAGLFLKTQDVDVPIHVSVQDGIPYPEVYDVSPTPDSVWLGLSTGPAVVSKATHAVQDIHLANGTRLSTTTRTVWAEGDHVWVGTDHGLYSVSTSSLVAEPVPNPVNGSSFSHIIMGIGTEGPMLYISAANYGLVMWNRDTGESQHFDTSYRLHKPQYTRLLVTPANIWIATTGDGAVTYNRTYNKMLEYAGPDSVNALTLNDIRQMGQETWFATEAGISAYDLPTRAWRYYEGTPGVPWAGGASSLAVLDGQLYAGSASPVSTQVARYDRARDSWTLVDWWEGRSPDANVIQSCDLDGGRLLFGTGGGGADYYDLSTGHWARVGREPDDNGQLPDINVLSTAVDSQSRFFATYRGLSEYHRGSQTWSAYRTDGNPDSSQYTNEVTKVRITPADVWTASMSYKQTKAKPTLPDVWTVGNVGHMDRATGAWTFYTKASGLSSDNVTTVLPDGGTVWIGTTLGLDRLDVASGAITHVIPAPGRKGNEYVTDILRAHDGTVWVTAALAGLASVDPKNNTVTPIPQFRLGFANTLVEFDGKIWVGTEGHGLYNYDPASKQMRSYWMGGHNDRIHCIIVHEGILYAGDDWGVQRFDLTANRWLPQVILPRSPETSSRSLRLAFTAPAPDAQVPPGSTLAVSGTSQGPADAVVQVRVGNSPWQNASGLASWSAGLDLDPTAFGPVPVHARLVAHDASLAGAILWVNVGVSGGEASFAPILEATQGDSVDFPVHVDPSLTEAQGTVFLRLPGESDWARLPMALAQPGLLLASSPSLPSTGQAEYVILVNWTGGGVRFPELFSSFGYTYPLTIQPIRGLAQAFIASKDTTVYAEPGGSVRTLSLSLQNTGTRSATVSLEASDEAAQWLSGLPGPLLVKPGRSEPIQLNVTVPAGTPLGAHPLTLSAHLSSSEGKGYDAHFNVTVVDSLANVEKSKRGTDALPVLVPLLALVILAAGRRRSRQP
jgi:ligand-binding sensor domain-containing protein